MRFYNFNKTIQYLEKEEMKVTFFQNSSNQMFLIEYVFIKVSFLSLFYIYSDGYIFKSHIFFKFHLKK